MHAKHEEIVEKSKGGKSNCSFLLIIIIIIIIIIITIIISSLNIARSFKVLS